MKRRMNLIPLYYKPEVIDRDLYEKLKPEHPRILNWMLEGCEDWLKNGFAIPQCVLDETAEYFAEQDLTAQWIGENCEIAEGATERAGTLLDDWKEFMVSMGESNGLNKTRFGNEMKSHMGKHGFYKKHIKGGTMYFGIRLRGDEAPATSSEMLHPLESANTIQPLVVLEKV